MPHLYIEYTDNLTREIDIQDVLAAAQKSLLQFPEIIPIGGLRIRAVTYEHYIIADGQADDAFIHLVLKIGAGRSASEKERITEALFDAVSTQLDAVFERRNIALSLELHEFTYPTLKRNNIHARFK